MSIYTPTPCRGRNCKSDGSGVSPDGDHSKECLNDAELMICGIDAIIAERDEARAALSADGGEDKRDAERYRWLRDEHIGDDPEAIGLRAVTVSGFGLDATIDAAIAANQARKGE